MYQTVVANLSHGVRREHREGREYLVAPLTLICPGVLNGSQGALYYPPEEIAQSADAWNDIPITVYHPRDGVSVDSPGVIGQQGVGVIQNATANGCLRAEGWFDAEKTRAVDMRIYKLLVAGRQIELSTGLFTDNEATANGPAIARNYRPDHLAVLPDQVGACSVEDGCGVLVNENTLEGEDMESMFRTIAKTAKRPLPSHDEITAQLDAEEAQRAGRFSLASADSALPRRRIGPQPLPSNAEYEYEMGLR